MSEPLNIGETYIIGDQNPWSDGEPIRAEIIDLRKGWVRYKRKVGKIVQIDAAKESYFRNAYPTKE